MNKAEKLIFGAPLALATYAIFKFLILYQFIILMMGTDPVLPYAQFRSDIILVMLSMVILLIAEKYKNISKILAIFTYFILVLMAADLITLMTIGHRFLFYEALAFDSLTGVDGFLFVVPAFGFLVGSSIFIGYILSGYLKNTLLFKTVIITVIIAIGYGKTLPPNLESSAYNVLFQNTDWRFSYTSDGNASRYTSQFYQAPESIKKPNVILLLAESFSAADSFAVSGLVPSKLPMFDQLSKKGLLLRGMVSEGCSTDRAYVTLLNGIPPFAYNTDPNRYIPYILNKTLAHAFKDAGYYTVFEKTFTLDFLKLRPFLEHSGFDEFYGRDEVFGYGNYVFNAKPDEILYEDIIQRIQKHQLSPLFIMATTISTHMPYSTPLGNTREDAYSYSDKTLSNFVRDLEKCDFFQDGILIITGDHRRMSGVSIEERKLYGDGAYGRVATLILGQGIVPKIDERIYSLSDIHYSLKALIGKGVLRRDYNNFFTGNYQRDFSIHNLGINPSSFVKITHDKNHFFSIGEGRDKENSDAYDYVQDIRAYYQRREGL